MAGTFLKWLVPGVVTIIAGTALAASQTAPTINSDLSERASAALDPQQFGWAKVTISGRDAIISGTATSQAAIDSAVDRVAMIRGVRAVTSNVALAEFVSPFPFVATVKSGAVALGGAYPDESVHASLIAAAGKPTDSMYLASGAPAGFNVGAKFAVDAAINLDEGEARLSDTDLSIDGRAKSPAAFESLQTLAKSVPAGIRLAALRIVPPLVSPYVWTATFDGKSVAITGDAPSPDLAEQLRHASSGVEVSTTLTLASGEPSGFTDNTLVLLQSLLKLEQGEATIADGSIGLAGAPPTAAIAQEVTDAITKLGGKVSLEPPRVADFKLVVTKTGSKLIFAGVVPDSASRDKLAALRDSDVTGVTLARGGPEGFGTGLDYGLGALAHLADGQFSIDGTALALSGRASSVSDFKATTDLVAQGAPQGFRIASEDLHPPVADTFTWTATKSSGGGVSIAGFVPDEPTRQALDAKVAKLDSDNADPADGAPKGFAEFAGKGLDVLALLDSGTLKYDGTGWSIDGNVDSTRKGFAADAAYSAAGLRTAGWTYKVHLPTLPIIAPYVWRAEKSAAGVSFSGFAPSDEFKAAVKELAPASADTTVLGSGAPENFETSASAGVTALMALDEGSLALAGDRWTLTGTIADAASRDAVQSALNAKVDSATWQVAIQARDAAPVASPYVWSATKGNDENVVLTGYLPSAALRAEATTLAGGASTDNSSIASGEPMGFADDMRAGLAALSHLKEGKATFDGGKWHLSGFAVTADDAAAANAALQKGSRGGTLWTSDVESEAVPLSPSSSASSASSSSSAEAPSSSSSSALVAPDVTSMALSSSVPLSSSSEIASSEAASSSEPLPSSSSEIAASSSSEEPSPSIEPSSSSEPSSSEPMSSSISSTLSSSSSQAPIESSSEAPSPASSTEPSSSASSEAAPDREVAPTTLSVVPPMPDSFVFAAVRKAGGPISLAGSVPDAATATAYGTLAGGAKTDKLTVDTDLPADFAANGTTGISALAELIEGRLGFDGSRWWLRGKAAQKSVAADVSAKVAALPAGSSWSVAIDVLEPIDACRMKVDGIAKRNAIVFEAGKAELMPSSVAVLDELAEDLKACADTYIHVQGHTDSDGDADRNLALSVSRAETVVAELVKRGISDSRFYAEGFGESDPIASNDTKDGKAKNRRITFEITPE